MEASLELVDWGWLTSFPDPQEWVDALQEADERKTRTESCYDFDAHWNDSDTLQGEVFNKLEGFAAEADPRTKRLVRTGFSLILSEDLEDVLGLADASYGVFYATLSPDAVKNAALALRSLDLGTLAGRLDS